MAVERFAAADDEEFQRLEVREVVAIEDIRHVVHRDRFPDVHSDQHIPLADALLCSWTFLADGGNLQPAAIACTQSAELGFVDRRELEAQLSPDPTWNFVCNDRFLSFREHEGDRFRLAVAVDFHGYCFCPLASQKSA